MDQKSALKNLQPLDIVIFHVGGVGGYGPVRKVIDLFPQHVVIVCFEANPSEKDKLIQRQYAAKGVRTVFVPKCVGAKEGKQAFYVNKRIASSSIFPVSPEAAKEHVPYPDAHTWGENCELDHVTEFDTVTLDKLVAEGSLPNPDILSMDSQGSELPIMRGGEHVLKEILSVVCEVDFIELYEGQELFPAQQQFLTERGFRLADILNTQFWHPGPTAGEGFLTMGEALYFRSLKASQQLSLPKLIKLAATAFAFKRVSFSSMVISLALDKFGSKAESVLLSHLEFEPMFRAQQYMQQHQADYAKDNKFFYRRSMWERAGEWKDRAGLAFRIKAGAALRSVKKSIKAFGGKAAA